MDFSRMPVSSEQECQPYTMKVIKQEINILLENYSVSSDKKKVSANPKRGGARKAFDHKALVARKPRWARDILEGTASRSEGMRKVKLLLQKKKAGVEQLEWRIDKLTEKQECLMAEDHVHLMICNAFVEIRKMRRACHWAPCSEMETRLFHEIRTLATRSIKKFEEKEGPEAMPFISSPQCPDLLGFADMAVCDCNAAVPLVLVVQGGTNNNKKLEDLLSEYRATELRHANLHVMMKKVMRNHEVLFFLKVRNKFRAINWIVIERATRIIHGMDLPPEMVNEAQKQIKLAWDYNKHMHYACELGLDGYRAEVELMKRRRTEEVESLKRRRTEVTELKLVDAHKPKVLAEAQVEAKDQQSGTTADVGALTKYKGGDKELRYIRTRFNEIRERIRRVETDSIVEHGKRIYGRVRNYTKLSDREDFLTCLVDLLRRVEQDRDAAFAVPTEVQLIGYILLLEVLVTILDLNDIPTISANLKRAPSQKRKRKLSS